MKILNKTDMAQLENVIENTKAVGERLKGLDLPEPIVNLLDAGANAYSDSNATTNAGRILRFICRFIKPSTIIKMFAHKLSN